MMNAAMMIAPTPQANNIKAGGKAAAEQGQLFGQAMAQQEQQVVFQSTEQEQAVLSGLLGRGVLLGNVAELLGENAGQMMELQPEQQDLLEQIDAEMLEQLDAEMLEGLALLLEQGMVPNSMDPAQLQQLVDLVEEFLPEWQFHNQVVVEPGNGQELQSEPQDPALEQKIEELIAWFSQYQEQQQRRDPSGHKISAELPPGQLVAGQKLELVRERLTQLRAIRSEAGNSAESVKTEGEVKGQQPATSVARAGNLVEGQETGGSPLEARFSDLLKPRSAQAGQLPVGQVTESSRQAQSPQQGQQTSVNQGPVGDSGDFFAKVLEKSAPQVLPAQTAMNARVTDGLHPQHNLLHGQQVPVAVAAQGITAPVAAAAPFAASQQVVDSQIFDQVVTHLSGSDKGDMGRMVLRLHPAELGSLRIELMVEGDKVRANLHAQTQQVQEVLERNLGQLRNALAEQGLKIDHFQVSSDARQNQQQGQAEDLARQRHEAEQSAKHQHADKEEPLVEDQAIPLAHLTQNGGRGISLHV